MTIGRGISHNNTIHNIQVQLIQLIHNPFY
jgi:hypothetical protein